MTLRPHLPSILLITLLTFLLSNTNAIVLPNHPSLPISSHHSLPIPHATLRHPRQSTLHTPSRQVAPVEDEPRVPWFERYFHAGRITFVAVHVVGVLAIAMLSFRKIYYSHTVAGDIVRTFCFYVFLMIFLASSFYLCYVFNSPDLLLIGIGINIIDRWKSLPRAWAVKIRKAHLRAPMWRTWNGVILKRTRRTKLNKEEKQEEFQHAYKQTPHLENGAMITELVEKDPLLWEKNESNWRTFVSSARTGNPGAHRAALALRMAHSVPMPAVIDCCGTGSEVNRGATGSELTDVWSLDKNELAGFEKLFVDCTQPKPVEFTKRWELAVALHIKMLLQNKSNSSGFDDREAQKFLFGHLVCSFHNPLPNVLAWGRVSGSASTIWNIISKHDERANTFRDMPEQRLTTTPTPEAVLQKLANQEPQFVDYAPHLNSLLTRFSSSALFLPSVPAEWPAMSMFVSNPSIAAPTSATTA